MGRILVFAMMLPWLAITCGGGNNNGSSDGGSSSGGTNGGSSGQGSSGGDYSQYNTLTGTFQSNSGIHATFSGAINGLSVGEYGAWDLVGSFDGQSAPAVSVSSPAGASAVVGIEVQNILGGSLVAATYTCAEAEDAGTPTINIEFNLTNSAVVYGAATSLQTGGPCTLTVDTPSFIKGPNIYFAHGSMTATLVGTFPDGGTDMGTMTATW